MPWLVSFLCCHLFSYSLVKMPLLNLSFLYWLLVFHAFIFLIVFFKGKVQKYMKWFSFLTTIHCVVRNSNNLKVIFGYICCMCWDKIISSLKIVCMKWQHTTTYSHLKSLVLVFLNFCLFLMIKKNLSSGNNLKKQSNLPKLNFCDVFENAEII